MRRHAWSGSEASFPYLGCAPPGVREPVARGVVDPHHQDGYREGSRRRPFDRIRVGRRHTLESIGCCSVAEEGGDGTNGGVNERRN